MSLWDNVKKFAAPYSDDDYDDYDEDEEDTEDDYEEEEERPARRSAPARRSRAAAPVDDEPEEDEDSDFGFGSISTSGSGSSALGSSSGFNGPVLHTGSSANKQEVVLFRPGSFNDTSNPSCIHLVNFSLFCSSVPSLIVVICFIPSSRAAAGSSGLSRRREASRSAR